MRAVVAGGRRIRCDVVGMSGGWQPADELRFQATSRDAGALVVGERARADPGAPLRSAGAVVGARTADEAFAQGMAAV